MVKSKQLRKSLSRRRLVWRLKTKKKATAKQDLADTEESLADTQAELVAKSKECKHAEAEYEASEKGRQQEIKGIQAAIQILNGIEDDLCHYLTLMWMAIWMAMKIDFHRLALRAC